MKKIFKISLITIGAFILLLIIISVFAPEENESEQKAIKTESEAPMQKVIKPSSTIAQEFDKFSLK